MRLTKYINEIKQFNYDDVIDALKKNCAPFLKELKQTGRKKFLFRGHQYASRTITKKKTRQDRTPKDMDEKTSSYLDNLFKKKFGWFARSAGVFATADIGETYEYGKPFLFFPIGKYKYIWSPVVDDLYTKIDNKDLSLENIEERFNEYHYNNLIHDGEFEGRWEYDGIDLQIDGDRDDAIEELEYNFEMFGIENDEDIRYSLLKFIPDITFEQFIEQKEDSIKEDLKDLVSSYTNKNLKQAIDFKGEITFSCKEYYLILESLEDVLTREFF